MEWSLHRQLKEQYGTEIGGQSEVAFEGFRIDAMGPDGRLVEIQSSPLGLLKRKLTSLLPSSEIVVVKPVVFGRRVIRRDSPEAPDLSARRSPKRGRFLDVFEELVALARIFPHQNLRIDLLAVEIDEIRVARRRRPGYRVVDRILRETIETVRLESSDDLWSLLPDDLGHRFTTEDLARSTGRTTRFAQQVSYCLLHAGEVEVVNKVGNRRIYAKVDRSLSGSAGPTGLSLIGAPRRGR